MRKLGCCIKAFGKALYVLIGKRLPLSYARFGGHAGKMVRGYCARIMLESCGKNVNVERMAEFSCQIKLGDNSGIGAYSIISSGTEIGRDVMMGPHCTIYTRNHRFDRIDIPMIAQGFQATKPVVIGDDVWIGGDVKILPGVTVGRGAILGAGAIVTHDVPPYAIVAGNPARVVRYRGNKESQ